MDNQKAYNAIEAAKWIGKIVKADLYCDTAGIDVIVELGMVGATRCRALLIGSKANGMSANVEIEVTYPLEFVGDHP